MKLYMERMNLTGKRIISLFLSIVCLSACGGSPEKSPPVRRPAPKATAALIEETVSGWKALSKASVRREDIYSADLVEGFYEGRNHKPAWSQDGRLSQVDALIRAVEDAYGDGLTPSHYHLKAIEFLANRAGKTQTDTSLLADLDILLTDAFITLGCHLSAGCVDPVTIQTEWFAKQGEVDVASVLDQALRKGKVRESLTMLRPEQGPYERLRGVLARYREISSKGDWPPVTSGVRLEKGSISGRVAELRKRLAASGDLAAAGADAEDYFDEKLRQSVISFQRRHGLEADGIVGSATVRALDVPLKQRIRQIELNMERLRWIFGSRDGTSIVVNIADFRLNVIKDWKPVLSMKVVVGKPYWKTPVFTAKMRYLIINPAWNVPDSIARREILKIVKKDPRYLSEQNMKVLKGWGRQAQEIDPGTIDWSRITPRNLPYRFRQEPGPLNPLGRIKFMLPNKYDVYLHDTPARGLFSRDMRAFSHGCTRIEKPLELALYLLRDDPSWTRKSLVAAIDEGVERKIVLPHPLDVHFLYLTAWVDGEGVLQFRNDIYGRDDLLDKALHGKPSFN